MKRINYFIFLVTLTLALFSCEKESFYQTSIEAEGDILLKSSMELDKEKEYYDKNIRKFAKALAKSLRNEDIRIAIKNEALLKPDGEYDIIWKNFKGKKIKTKKGSTDLINIISDEIESEGKTNALEELEVFNSKNKKMQISVPVHCNDWDVNNTIPLVAFQTSGYSERDDFIQAYDSKGKLQLLDNKIAPDFPVIVVNLNERSDENGDILDIYKNSELKSTSLVNFDLVDYYPLTPTNFNASFNMNGVSLSWDYQWTYQYLDLIELERLNNGIYQMLPQFPMPAYNNSYLDTEATDPGSEYYYRLRIRREITDEYGNTQTYYSNYVTAYVRGNNLQPNKPGELYIANLAPDNIELRWGKPSSSSYSGFKLYRRRPGISDYTLIANVESDVYYYIDKNLEGKGEKYHYYIVAYNDAGDSEPVWEVTYNPYRSENQKLVITKFEISNYSRYESWSNAGPEVRFSLAASDSPSSTSAHLIVSKETIPVVEDGATPDPATTTIRKWKVSNSSGYYEALRNWDSEFFASVLTINCYENDGSWLGNVNFNFSAKIPIKIDSTATIETTFGGQIELEEEKSKAMQFGTDWLYFWDPEIYDLTVGPDLTLHFETR